MVAAYPFHEAASIFDMMPDAEINELAADIKKTGLLNPIYVHEGLVIDGRNRYLACERAGVAHRFKEWNGEGSLISFVISLNLNRRHLTNTQRAMAAARAKPLFEEEAKARMTSGTLVPEQARGKSAGKAAAAFRVSRHSVESASAVQKRGTQALVDAVDSGGTTLTAAAELAKLTPKEQLKAIRKDAESYRAKSAKDIAAAALTKCKTLWKKLTKDTDKLDPQYAKAAGYLELYGQEIMAGEPPPSR